MRAEVNGWLARLIPARCALCGLDSGRRRLCKGCRNDLPQIVRACGRCSAPLPQGVGTGRCAACDLTLAGIDRVRAALVYEQPVDHLVVAAKFGGRLDCAHALGETLARCLDNDPLLRPCDAIVPVPLHKVRLARRGYNQAAVIGKRVAQSLRIPLRMRLCERRRSTAAQSALSGRARRLNVRGAFVATDAVEGLRVAIVDDVVTTGHTLSALALALREAGAAGVDAWCAARVVADQGARKV